MVEKPKLREIIAADFRDRVVHHVLVERLNEIFEPKFIYDSYACRTSKGVYAAVRRLQDFIYRQRGQGSGYYLQLDIKSFFINIDKNILYSLIRNKVRDKDLLWLTREIIFYTPAANYIIKGNKQLLAKLPDHKSLLKAPVNKGLPMGNLSSQFFANLYLNELDQFVKHDLKCKYYLRYCDDFILFNHCPEQLGLWKEQIREFLRTRLLLELNENYGQILAINNGIDYLGYVSRYSHILVRNRVVRNFRHKLDEFKTLLVCQSDNLLIYNYDYIVLDKLNAVIASYLGHLNKADSYRLQQSVFEEFDWLHEYFAVTDLIKTAREPTKYFSLKPKYKQAKTWKSIREQYGYYRHYYPDSVVLFQVGSYYEFYHELDDKLLAVLRLSRLKENKRKAFYGFPKRKEGYYCNCLLKSSYQVLIVCETGINYCRIKERVPKKHLFRNQH